MFQSSLTILVFLPILIASKEPWSYEDMTHWSNVSRYCDGHLQSPINLEFNISTYDRHLKSINLQKRNSAPLHLVNKGHTAQLNLAKSYVIEQIPPYTGTFIVEQLHFHWDHSNNTSNGSEHLLEGQAFPLEMHVVSYSDSFANLSEAMFNVRGLAVIGVFFELSTEPNEVLTPIINSLKHVQHNGNQHSLDTEFDLLALFHTTGIRRYYRYDGSLTTPPCYESVIWTVLQEPLKISADQLNTFRNLHESRDKLMKNTYRSIQKLEKRKLSRSFRGKHINNEPQERHSTAGSDGQYSLIHIPIYSVLISFLLFIF